MVGGGSTPLDFRHFENIMPRVTITPEDALFCAIFFKQLHSLETTNFSSLNIMIG